ncbi:hypothetical protein ABZ023_17820 [Streptomyces sp. NPDC006367]|uniref:hypothetical protein n=1 Tax=unclassified Streptomyces TaxID=2593676 RepID=UPI0033BF4BD2
MSAYVEIPRPYESGPGRFTVELRFPAASKRRAVQHHHVAWHLAGVHGVEASTPYAVNPRWSVYEENWGNGERHGWLDERRLRVEGAPRALAGYLAVLGRVLDEVEALATRAVRVFGAWKRSAAAEPFLVHEDASTMRARVREFRADALRALVRGLGTAGGDVPGRDASRPLWEQYKAVAGEVWAAAGGIDLEGADDEAVSALVARMAPAVVVEAERLAVLEAARVEAEHLEAELLRPAGAVPVEEAGEADAGQGALFPVSDARPPLVVKPRRFPGRRGRLRPEVHAVPAEAVERLYGGRSSVLGVGADRRRFVPVA